MIVLGQIRTYARRALWTMDCFRLLQSSHQNVQASTSVSIAMAKMSIKRHVHKNDEKNREIFKYYR